MSEGSREGDKSREPRKKSLQRGRAPGAVILGDLGSVAERANIEQNYSKQNWGVIWFNFSGPKSEK